MSTESQKFYERLIKLSEGGHLSEFVDKVEEARHDSLAQLIDSEDSSPKEREAKAMVRAINKLYAIPEQLLFVEEPQEE